MHPSVGVLAALCTAPEFFNSTTKVINIDMGVCYNFTMSNESVSTCDTYWFSTAPNVTAISPSSVEENLSGWTFKPQSELASSLPLSKPLLIDCPMPICAFPISGTYSDLQRYLVYANLLIAAVATTAPLLRGISQLFLATNAMSSLLHFVVIFALRKKHLVDMDFMPALMYSITGIISTLIWGLFRSSVFNSELGYFLVIVLPAFMPYVCMNLVTFFLILDKTGFRTSVVLLESATAFRLTSICYGVEGGGTSLWSGPFDYGIRQPGELQIILPPEGSYDLPAPVVEPVPVFWTLMGINMVGFAFFLFYAFRACIGACQSGSNSWTVTLSFLSRFPEAFQQLFSPGLAPSGHARDRILLITPEFRAGMANLTFFTVPYLVFIVFLEIGIHRNNLPRSDTPNQVGQWGTWVISVFVAIFSILLQHIGYSPQTVPDTPGPKLPNNSSQQQLLQPVQPSQDHHNPGPAHISHSTEEQKDMPTGEMNQQQQYEYQLRLLTARQEEIKYR